MSQWESIEIEHFKHILIKFPQQSNNQHPGASISTQTEHQSLKEWC